MALSISNMIDTSVVVSRINYNSSECLNKNRNITVIIILTICLFLLRIFDRSKVSVVWHCNQSDFNFCEVFMNIRNSIDYYWNKEIFEYEQWSPSCFFVCFFFYTNFTKTQWLQELPWPNLNQQRHWLFSYRVPTLTLRAGVWALHEHRKV